MNAKVDQYLIDGCGRCKFYKTPRCKVNSWRDLLKKLRAIVLECGLQEEYKWSQPCYTFNGKNVLIKTAFKGYAALSFFKGALLKDSDALLVAAGKSSQSGRLWRFTKIRDVIDSEKLIKAYITEAIAVEKAGLKVEFKQNLEPVPEELEKMFDKNKGLKKAFYSLTPGRQRGYILYFSQPKQSKTRNARIEKWIPKILNGIGMHDEYRSSKK